jgi:hypothetical protein
MDMKLAHFTLQTQIKVKEELFYCCSTFDSLYELMKFLIQTPYNISRNIKYLLTAG